MPESLCKKSQALTLPEGWVWQNFSGNIGMLTSPDNKCFYTYDATVENVPAVRYQKRGAATWYIFIGSLNEFQAFAESSVLSELYPQEEKES